MTEPRDTAALPQLLILGAVLCLGSYLRLTGVGSEALFGDELHTLGQVDQGLGSILTHFDARGSHVVLPLLQHLCLELFGDGLFSMRLPALIPGLLTLWLIYPIGRRLVGHTPALLASAALALSPMHIFYSRFGRSYALSALLSLLLVHFLVRALEEEQPSSSRRAWLVSFVLAALLPYIHLSSAGFVGLAALVSIGCAMRRAGSPRAGLWPLLGFSLALLACLAAFAPIWSQVQSYLNDAMPEHLKKSPTTLTGIPILLAGGSIAAGLMLVLTPLGLLGIGRKRGAAALLMASTFLGPALALWITRPHGMEYAYARYLLSALPFLPMAMAWPLWRLAQRVLPSAAAAQWASLAVGLTLIGSGFATGPSFGPRPATPVFNNSYLAMHALPAFDADYPGRHAFYDELRADEQVTRIVEYPVLQTRAALYYRQLAMIHGKQVLLGWPKEMPLGMGQEVYVSMESVDAQDADYIILHRDPVAEVKRYWEHVYGLAGPREEWGSSAGFLERHRSHFAEQALTQTRFLANEAARLRERLGPATFKDQELLIWRLRP